jgi:Protein of unknown function (DUF2505)
VRFRITTPYDADPDAVARAYADPALYEAFAGLPRADRPDVLEHRVDGTTAMLRVRWQFTAPLSPAVRAVIDPDRLSWVEESNHDLIRRRVTFRMVPDHYPDRLTCTGEYRFEADGTGSARVVEGDLRVKAPFVARAIENAIASGLEEQLASERPIVEAFVAGRRG